MLRVIIIDDDKRAIELLSSLLLEVNPHVTIVKTFTDPIRFLAQRKNLSYDVLFLDIEMPGLNGFEVLAGEQKPVVLVSGKLSDHIEEVSDALNHKVVTHLPKPVNAKRVIGALNKIQDLIPQPSVVQFTSSQGIAPVKLSDIQLICSSKHIVATSYGTGDPRDKVVFICGAKPIILKDQTIDSVLTLLPSGGFYQISSQVIISKEFVKTYRSTSVDVMIHAGAQTKKCEFEIGKAYRTGFNKFMGN